mmetsp:Transcript_1454/g.4387  ORF Transcript_1454/g.4387 Transcript_1454/m.4387 type:complete len:218 (+) Transcript_1454:1725-2378(+)
MRWSRCAACTLQTSRASSAKWRTSSLRQRPRTTPQRWRVRRPLAPASRQQLPLPTVPLRQTALSSTAASRSTASWSSRWPPSSASKRSWQRSATCTRRPSASSSPQRSWPRTPSTARAARSTPSRHCGTKSTTSRPASRTRRTCTPVARCCARWAARRPNSRCALPRRSSPGCARKPKMASTSAVGSTRSQLTRATPMRISGSRQPAFSARRTGAAT